MKTIKIVIVISALVISIMPCQSQNIQYRSKLRPKVKMNLDSLYPHATDVILDQSSIHDSIQIIRLVCNCHDTSDLIVLVFDTNGNILNREIHYNNHIKYIKDLPDPIASYIKNNTSSNREFIKDDYTKIINNKGEISYGIIMNYFPNSWSVDSYTLKFKSTGELISKEEIPKAGW